MAALILLNGPPAAGKSTLATRLVAQRPLALNLDIDVVRGHLGGWLGHPHEAGLAARVLALAMTDAHLAAGHDVVIAQYLARPEFIEQLAAAAQSADAHFVELALQIPRSVAIAAFGERSANPSNRTHVDAACLVEQSTAPNPVGTMYDDLQTLLAGRPGVRQVRVVRDDIDATLITVIEAISAAGVKW